jgi:hypothetical protein
MRIPPLLCTVDVSSGTTGLAASSLLCVCIRSDNARVLDVLILLHFFKAECVNALKRLALSRASHSRKIALAGSHRLRSTLAAAPLFFTRAALTLITTSCLYTPNVCRVCVVAGKSSSRRMSSRSIANAKATAVKSFDYRILRELASIPANTTDLTVYETCSLIATLLEEKIFRDALCDNTGEVRAQLV